MEIGGLLRGLGGGLCDGLGDVVAGDGLAREGVGELGPRQQLRDGRQLQVVEVNIDLLQYSQYAEKAPAFKHGFSTRNGTLVHKDLHSPATDKCPYFWCLNAYLCERLKLLGDRKHLHYLRYFVDSFIESVCSL